jgi:hypothetical protein
MTSDCHEIPSQYIRRETLENSKSSLLDKSTGTREDNDLENPNITFIQDRKKNVGPNKYKNTSKNMASKGKRSKKKLKNKNSDTKNIDPGNPKKIKLFSKVIKKSFGHMKFKPLISVKSLVLNLRAMASTSKNEFVDNRA